MLEIFKCPGRNDQSLTKLDAIIGAIQLQRYLPLKVRQDAVKVLETMRWIRVNQTELALFIDSKEKYLNFIPIRDRDNQVVRDHFGTSLHFNAYKKGDGVIAVNTLISIIEFFESGCLALLDAKKTIQFSNLILQFNYDKSRGCFEARVAKAKLYLAQLQSLPEGIDQLEDILQVYMHTLFNRYSLYNYLVADTALSIKYGGIIFYAGQQTVLTQDVLFSAMQDILAFEDISAEFLQKTRERSQNKPQEWHQEIFKQLVTDATVNHTETKGHQYLFSKEAEALDLLKWFGQSLSAIALDFDAVHPGKEGEQFSVTLNEAQWKYLIVLPVPDLVAKPVPSAQPTPVAPVSKRSRLSRWTPLHEAASFGNHETVRELILIGDNLAAMDRNGVVPIEVAARFSHWQCVQTIAETAKETADGAYRYGSALLIAAQERQTDVVVALAQAQAGLTEICREKNRTALHWAAHHGDVTAIKALLNAGADLAACDLEKLTPIEVAAKAKQWECVKAIATHTKEVDEQKYHFGAALLHAVYANQLDLVRVLVKADARVSWSFPSTKQTALHIALHKPDKLLLEILLESNHLCIAQDNNHCTPIKLAYDKNDWNMVATLATKMTANRLYSFEYGSLLIDAAMQGKTEAVIALAKAKADLTMLEQDKKWTALHRVAHDGHVDCVIALIEAGADLAAQDTNNNTPIQCAANARQWSCVIAIANQKKETANGAYKYGEALLAAVLEGKDEVIEVLVAAGAGMTAVTSELGYNVLHIAVCNQNQRLLETLLKSPYAVLLADHNGRTPIGRAQAFHLWPMVAAIADRQLRSKESAGEYGSILVERAKIKDIDAVLKLIKVGADLSKVTASDKRTALHWIVIHNALECVPTLIEAGADLAALDEKNQTPMRLAVVLDHWGCVERIAQSKSEREDSAFHYGNALLVATAKQRNEAVKALVDANAPVTWTTTPNNSLKLPAMQTALHVAVRQQDFNLLEILLTSKRITLAKDADNLTPIQLAASKCLWNFVVAIAERIPECPGNKHEYEKILLDAAIADETPAALSLLKAGADPSYADRKDGRTPLHWAVLHSTKLLVSALLVSKADSQVADTYHCTPLSYALDTMQHEIIDILLKHKIDITTCGVKNKMTALHWAASTGKEPWVQALITANASLSVLDQKGETPIMTASMMNKWGCVKLIAEKQHETLTGDYEYAKVLLSAVSQNKEDVAISLINAGARIDLKVDKNKNNVFHLVVQTSNEKIIKVLNKSKYATEQLVYENKNAEGLTVFELCGRLRRWHCARLLLDHLPVKNNYAHLFGQMLALAAQDNQLELVKLLISQKAALNGVSVPSNMTALHWSVMHQNQQMLVELIKSGADLRKVDSNGLNPIQTAAKLHDWKTVLKITELSKQEFKYESDLFKAVVANQTLKVFQLARSTTELPWYFSNDLMTSIHWAAFYGNIAVCEFLLARGADPILTDKKGRNAIKIAIEMQHIECALFICAKIRFTEVFAEDFYGLNIANIIVRINNAIRYKDAPELDLYDRIISDYLAKIPSGLPAAIQEQKKEMIKLLQSSIRIGIRSVGESSTLPGVRLETFLRTPAVQLSDVYEPFVDSLISSCWQNFSNIVAIEKAYYAFLSANISAYRLGNYIKCVYLSLSSGIMINELYQYGTDVDKLIFSHCALYKNFCGWQPQAWSGFVNQLKSPQSRAALRCRRVPNTQPLYKYYHHNNSIGLYKKGDRIKPHHTTHAKKQSMSLLSPQIVTNFFGHNRLPVGVLMEVDQGHGSRYDKDKVKIKAMFIQDIGTYGRGWIDTQQNLHDYVTRIQPIIANTLQDLRERTLLLERCNEILGEPCKGSIRAVVVGRLDSDVIEKAKRYQQDLKDQLGISVPIALYDYKKHIVIPNIAPLLKKRERLQALFSQYRQNRYIISEEFIQLEQALNGDYLTLGDRIRELFVTESFYAKEGRLFTSLENTSFFARYNTDHVMREVRKEFNL